MSNTNSVLGAESSQAKKLREACEAAAHAFHSLIASDDDVLAALRKTDGGEELVEEIREVDRAWTDASQAFLDSLREVAREQA